MWFSTSKASAEADWSFSSPETRPRQKSELTTSKGSKTRAAKVDFPDPETPTSTTSDSSGTGSSMGSVMRDLQGEQRQLGG